MTDKLTQRELTTIVAKLIEEATAFENAASYGDSYILNGRPTALMIPDSLRETAATLRKIASNLTFLISDDPASEVGRD